MERTSRCLATPVPITDVRLLECSFQTAQEINGEYLLALEPDRLLARFRQNAGLPPIAEPYGGWESMGVSGHSLGHYLSALAWHYAATDSQAHLERLKITLVKLAECQGEDGSLSAIPNAQEAWAQVRSGDIRSQGFDLNGMWVPWYTQHKILAGLIDAFEIVGDPLALLLASRHADWIENLTEDLTDEAWQQMLDCEHGGMEDALLRIFEATHYDRYRTLAHRFEHRKVLSPLRGQRDELAGLHSNTQIPKLLSLATDYEQSGDLSARTACEFFWDRLVNHRTYANGGNSNHEHLGRADILREELSDGTSETCNTYNLLKLTRHLFQWNPDASYFDFYERALFNHILASQNGEIGGFTYFVPMRPRAIRPFSKPFSDFWCCVGTGMENHTRYGDSIYFTSERRLYVNLFVPSHVKASAVGLEVRITTELPSNGVTKLELLNAPDQATEIAIRIPKWLATPIRIRLNGELVPFQTDRGYAILDQVWSAGDVLDIETPLAITTESMPDDRYRIAFFYGPLLLAIASEDLADDPALVGELADMAPSVKHVGELEFEIQGLRLLPFHSFTTTPYTTYVYVYSTELYETFRANQARIRSEQEALEARTIDLLRIAEMQPERDHKLISERSETGGNIGTKWRHALPGGWFEFKMKVSPTEANTLICKFWTGDENRDLVVKVDGIVVLSTRTILSNPLRFEDNEIRIRKSLTEDKSSVTVRFEASAETLTPGFYGCRMVKTNG